MLVEQASRWHAHVADQRVSWAIKFLGRAKVSSKLMVDMRKPRSNRASVFVLDYVLVASASVRASVGLGTGLFLISRASGELFLR